MTIDDDDLIPLAQPRDNPTAQAYRLLADGLTLNEALTRLTRQPMGLTDRLLLDGRPLVDIGPLQFDWSEDGLCCNVTVPTREVAL